MTKFDDTHILIAEDSATQALGLQLFLEKNGYQVFSVSDGKKAMAHLADTLPALIISDIEMPNMDGYELCQAVKNDHRLHNIPVMLLTSLSSPEDIIRGLDCQANNFMTKPYDEETLLSRVNYIMSNREMMSQSRTRMNLEVFFAGSKHTINCHQIQILELLLNSYDDIIKQYRKLEKENKFLKTQLESPSKL